MSLYAISDLHLSLSTDKPMNVFRGWDNYVERIYANWNHLVKPDDTVVLPGDLSWALKLNDTVKDFEFINALPGKKIILKGNHDLWWSTMKKMTEFFEENKFSTITPLHNTAVETEEYCVCGSRGWFYDDAEQNKKVVLRESARLDTSITLAEKTGLKPVVFLHYPPVYGDQVCHEMFDVIKEHNITQVYHGHIHGAGRNRAVKEYDGVKFKLISCDCVDFTPILVE